MKTVAGPALFGSYLKNGMQSPLGILLLAVEDKEEL